MIPKTDPKLLALIKRARRHVMSPSEHFEQRVSFVYGLLSSRSTMTKDEVRMRLSEGFGGH